MRAVEIEWKGQAAHLASLRDITKRKKAEIELLKTRENDFPSIGRRSIILNARQIVDPQSEGSKLILLAMEDVTGRERLSHLEEETQ